MSDKDWSNGYATAENRVNVPTGKTVRPFPGGQQWGHLLPTQNNPFAAQANSKVITLAYYDSIIGFESPITATFGIDISTPSRRLSCGVQVFYEFNTPISDVPIPGVTPLVVTLLQLGVNPQTGQTTPMNVITTTNGPMSRQVEPIYRDIRVEVTVNSFNLDYQAMGIDEARLVLVANWEPVVEIVPDELNRLYALCSVTVPQPKQV